MFIVDGHLDLAYNALRGRDVLKPAANQRADEEGIPTVGLPNLHAGHVRLICATIFCEPALANRDGYKTPDEAAAAGRLQMEWYRRLVASGDFRMVQSAGDLPGNHERAAETAGMQITGEKSALPILILLEGADPIRDPAEIPWWFSRGLRAVGLAWKQTRYAGGTGMPGPLTRDGVTMTMALDAAGIIHDTSHLAEQSFWQLLELTTGPVMASHSNCRAIVPTDRQLSDAMIRALAARGGIMGINFFDKFLLSPDEYGKRRATLGDLIRHIKHICDLLGSAAQVALGTDMDGGLGRDEIPVEIQSSADLPKIADALASAGFSEADIRGILGKNWLEFFRKSLPKPVETSSPDHGA